MGGAEGGWAGRGGRGRADNVHETEGSGRELRQRYGRGLRSGVDGVVLTGWCVFVRLSIIEGGLEVKYLLTKDVLLLFHQYNIF